MIVHLVPGSSEDLDSVMEVMNSAFPPRFGEAWTRSQCAGILPMTGVRLVIARDGDERSLGFSLYRTVAGDSELLLLAVDAGAQRNGIGRKLLDHFIEDARENGARQIHLEVRDGNSATRLYESAGFTRANRRRNYYRGKDGAQFDALTFVLTTGD
jgi:ribosomal-protein-alanine N-acetyltransferase